MTANETTNPSTQNQRVQDLVDGQVVADPLTRAVVDAAEAGAARALAAHTPRLTLSRAEAAELLGLSLGTVDRMLAAEVLTRLAGRITLASVLAATGWPIEPAPLAAPLSVVPTVGAA